MNCRLSVHILCVAAVVSVAFSGAANAQQRPSATSLLLAKQLIEAKSAMKLFDSIVSGVIEHHKNLLSQTNPNLTKDLDEVARKLHAELGRRKSEMEQEVVRIYAQHFSEQELKEAVAFYRTALGKKLIAEEPKALDESMKAANDWASKLAEEVRALMRAEMKKKGHNLI